MAMLGLLMFLGPNYGAPLGLPMGILSETDRYDYQLVVQVDRFILIRLIAPGLRMKG